MDPVINGIAAGVAGVGAEKAYEKAGEKYDEARRQDVCYLNEDGSMTCREEKRSFRELITHR